MLYTYTISKLDEVRITGRGIRPLAAPHKNCMLY